MRRLLNIRKILLVFIPIEYFILNVLFFAFFHVSKILEESSSNNDLY